MREAASVQATPRREASRDATIEPAATAETLVPVQQPQRITEATDDDDNDNTGSNDDMRVDYEATSAEEECGPSSEEEADTPPTKRQRLGQLGRRFKGVGGAGGAGGAGGHRQLNGRELNSQEASAVAESRIAKSIEQVYESLNRLCDKESLKAFIDALD